MDPSTLYSQVCFILENLQHEWPPVLCSSRPDAANPANPAAQPAAAAGSTRRVGATNQGWAAADQSEAGDSSHQLHTAAQRHIGLIRQAAHSNTRVVHFSVNQ